MKLEELAKDRAALSCTLTRLKKYTERYNNAQNEDDLIHQNYSHYEIAGYIWGMYEDEKITGQERDELIFELYAIQEIDQ